MARGRGAEHGTRTPRRRGARNDGPVTDPLPPTPDPQPDPDPVTDPTPLAPPPPEYRLPDPIQRTLTFPAPRPVPWIYGKVKTGGIPVFQKTDGLGRTTVVYLVCHGPINAIPTIWIEGKTLGELGYVLDTDYFVYTGTASQTVNTLVQNGDANWLSGLPGVAYVVIYFKLPADGEPPVDPYSFMCEVEGALVRDPRTDATLVNRYYRENTMLAIADVLTSKRIAGYADAEVDFAGTFTTAANDCDFVLSNGLPRWKIGIKIEDTGRLPELLDTLRLHCQGLIVWNNGKWQATVDKVKSVSGIIYTDDEIEHATMRVRGASEVPTHVVVKGTGQAAGYMEISAEVEAPEIVTLGRERVPSTYLLYGLPAYDYIRRAAVWIKNRRTVQDKEVRLIVNATGARALPGEIVEVTSSELNTTLQKVVVTDVTPMPKSQWEILGEFYDAAVHSDTVQTTSVAVTPTLPSPYDTPPAVVRPLITDVSGKAYVEWEAPNRRVVTQFGAAFWSTSGAGISGFVAAEVNDGDLSTTALIWSQSGDRLIFDAGVGNTKKFRELRVKFSSGDFGSDKLQWSDDGSAYNDATLTTVTDSSVTTYTNHYHFADAGARRYWSLLHNSAGSETITEVQLVEFDLVWPHIEYYRVLDQNGKVFATIEGDKRPSSTNPLLVEPLAIRTSSILDGSSSFVVSLRIEAVSLARKAGPYIDVLKASQVTASGFAPDFVPQFQQNVTLANGLNSDIPISATVDSIRITGPTGAFSIGGFSGANRAGRPLFIFCDVVFAMSFIHEDASSTAANRIFISSLATLTLLASRSTAVLVYVSTLDRWVLHVARDSAGPK